MAGAVLYAQRPTREEAEQVLEEQRHLARRFGLPVVVVPPIVSPLHPIQKV
jgi:predicted metal-dependent TIM-barrel fold hydrolase